MNNQLDPIACEIQNIEKYLTEKKLSFCSVTKKRRLIEVYIEWGDWKHDHHRLKSVMIEFGYAYFGKEITQQDGSDSYCAKHFFIKM